MFVIIIIVIINLFHKVGQLDIYIFYNINIYLLNKKQCQTLMVDLLVKSKMKLKNDFKERTKVEVNEICIQNLFLIGNV